MLRNTLGARRFRYRVAAVGRTQASPRTAQFLCAGTAVQDKNVVADRVKFQPGVVEITQGSQCYKLPFDGPPIAWGGKRTLSAWLDDLLGTLVPGGGGTNSALHAGRIIQERNLPMRSVLVDLAIASAELHSALQATGVNFVSPGIGTAPTNLVVTQHDKPEQRIVLKAPIDPTTMPELDADWLRRRLQAAGDHRPLSTNDMVLINSSKSATLTRMASDLAQEYHATQISVLTGSLSVAETIELLVNRDHVSHSNLSEFATLCSACGVECPDDENFASLNDIATALRSFTRQYATGDLVVTLGPRGAGVFDRDLDAVWHVTLKPAFAQLVRHWIEREPPTVNGSGDRFTAAFALAYQLSSRRQLRTLDATVRASMDAVTRLAPRLRPTASWFAVDPVPVR